MLSIANFESVIGTSRNDLLSAEGLSIDVTLTALAGDDRLKGGGGHDEIYAGAGNDTVSGGAGDDVIWQDIHWDHDEIDGGAGRNTVDYGLDTELGRSGRRLLAEDFEDVLASSSSTSYVVRSGYAALPGVVATVSTAPATAGLASVHGPAGPGDDFLLVCAAGDASLPFWGQAVELVEGRAYTLTYDIATASRLAGLTLYVNGQVMSMAQTHADAAWKASSITFVASHSGEQSIELRDSEPADAGVTFAVDNIQLGEALSTSLKIDLGYGAAWKYRNAGTDSLQGMDTLRNIQDANGSVGDDWILGSAEDNTLRGAAGRDTINGGAGNDTLIGGTGNDDLRGGLGNDLFGWNLAETGQDRVLDFQPWDGTHGDRLDIGALLTKHVPGSTANLSNWIRIETVGGDTHLSVTGDPDASAAVPQVITLAGVLLNTTDPVTLANLGVIRV